MRRRVERYVYMPGNYIQHLL